MLSRKYYQIIADAIAASRFSDEGVNLYQLEDNLSKAFIIDNPNFDATRFIAAIEK